MIVTLAQEPEHADECRASMFFAQNAAKVVNKPKKRAVDKDKDKDKRKGIKDKSKGGGILCTQTLFKDA